MTPTKPHCTSCRYMVKLEVAGDDRRMFCSSPATKTLPVPIGYLTTGEEAERCDSYQEGKPREEKLPKIEKPREQPEAVKPAFPPQLKTRSVSTQ